MVTLLLSIATHILLCTYFETENESGAVVVCLLACFVSNDTQVLYIRWPTSTYQSIRGPLILMLKLMICRRSISPYAIGGCVCVFQSLLASCKFSLRFCLSQKHKMTHFFGIEMYTIEKWRWIVYECCIVKYDDACHNQKDPITSGGSFVLLVLSSNKCTKSKRPNKS